MGHNVLLPIRYCYTVIFLAENETKKWDGIILSSQRFPKMRTNSYVSQLQILRWCFQSTRYQSYITPGQNTYWSENQKHKMEAHQGRWRNVQQFPTGRLKTSNSSFTSRSRRIKKVSRKDTEEQTRPNHFHIKIPLHLKEIYFTWVQKSHIEFS